MKSYQLHRTPHAHLIQIGVNQRGKQVGSLSLQMLFVSVAMLGFVSVVWDLSRYAVAKNAVAAASEATAACLASSSRICGEQHFQSEGDEELPWFGYPNSDRITAYAYTRDLDVSVTGGAHVLEVPALTLQSFFPEVAADQQIVPVTSYVGVLSSWAILKADVQIRFIATDGGNEAICTATDAVEVPWGLDFSVASAYFDNRWCDSVVIDDRFLADPACRAVAENAGAWRRAASADWGGSFCRLSLPGAPDGIDAPERAENPWLRLGGEPLCDDEVQGSDLRDPLPRAAPWGSAEPGEQSRPYPISGERQYLRLDVPSCDIGQSLTTLQDEYTIRSQDEAERTAALQALGAELGLQHSIAGAAFSQEDFDSGNSRSVFSTNASPAASAAPVNGINSSLYGWTYLIWERFLGLEAQGRSVTLTRKVCEWLPLSQAQAAGLSGIGSVSGAQSELRFLGAPLQCGSAFTARKSSRCSERLANPEDVSLELCAAGASLAESVRDEHADSLEALGHYRERLPRSLQAQLPSPQPVAAIGQDSNLSLRPGEFSQIYSPTPIPGWSTIAVSQRSLKIFGPEDRDVNNSDWLHLLRREFPASGSSEHELLEVITAARKTSHYFQNDSRLDFTIAAEDLDPEVLLESGLLASQSELEFEQSVFDSNLDCSFDEQSKNECPAAAESSLRYQQFLEEEILRRAGGNPEASGLDFSQLNVEVSEQLSEKPVQLRGVSAERIRTLLEPGSECLALLSRCERGAESKADFLGYAEQLPLPCLSGEYAGCYVDRSFGTDVSYAPESKFEEAARVGLAETKRFFPGIELADVERPAVSCESENCLHYEFTPESENQVRVRTSSEFSFIGPLRLLSGQNGFTVTVNRSTRLPR